MTVQTLAQLQEGTKTINKLLIFEVTESVPACQAVAARRRDEIERAIPKEYAVPPHLIQGASKSSLVQLCGLLSARE
jgi:hypothetical protein